LIHTPPSSIG